MLKSIIMASALATAVLANPLQHFAKRAYATVTAPAVTTTAIVATVTVYDGAESTGVAQTGNKDADTNNPSQHGQGQGGNWHNWGGYGWGHGGSHSQASEVTTQQPVTTYQPPAPSSSSQSDAPPASPPSPPQSAPAPAGTDYQEMTVYHHNIHRANHSAPALTWSDKLASSAQQIANSCIYAHNTDVAGGGYGQNIAAGVEETNISAVITDLFYNGEVGYYADQYGKSDPDMTNFEKWGHFTQIVWQGTTQVGCATKYCENGLANVGTGVSPYFTVCNYGPPGNYGGEYAENVKEPRGDATAQWNAGM